MYNYTKDQYLDIYVAIISACLITRYVFYSEQRLSMRRVKFEFNSWQATHCSYFCFVKQYRYVPCSWKVSFPLFLVTHKMNEMWYRLLEVIVTMVEGRYPGQQVTASLYPDFIAYAIYQAMYIYSTYINEMSNQCLIHEQ